jgi:quaternary ammonium compound-resistance protein SugE
MAWIYLLTAGALEVVATTIFRYTDGLSRVVPTVSFFAIGIASFYFLNRSLSGVPLGTAYAVWTGIGAAGTAVLGILAYGEGATLVRVALLVGLVACIVGLKFVAEH